MAIVLAAACGTDAGELAEREKARDEQIASLQQRILKLEERTGANVNRADRWWCGDRACYRDRGGCEKSHGASCTNARIAYCPVNIAHGLTCAPTLEACESRIKKTLDGDKGGGALSVKEAWSAFCLGGE